MDLLTYPGGEYPDPLSSCQGYQAPTGTPLLLLFDTDRQVTSANLTDDLGRSLEVCAFDRHSYTNPHEAAQDVGREALAGRNAAVVVPRSPLETTAGTRSRWPRREETCGGRSRPATSRRHHPPSPSTASPDRTASARR